MAITTLDLSADIIDTRDIIARIEELEDEMQGEIPEGTTWEGTEQAEELAALTAIMADLKGNGGDEQWRGDWYPVTLVREDYFTDYARDLCFDTGTIPSDLPEWVEIDWERTALNVRYDYTSTEINGVTYWYR